MRVSIGHPIHDTSRFISSYPNPNSTLTPSIDRARPSNLAPPTPPSQIAERSPLSYHNEISLNPNKGGLSQADKRASYTKRSAISTTYTATITLVTASVTPATFLLLLDCHEHLLLLEEYGS